MGVRTRKGPSARKKTVPVENPIATARSWVCWGCNEDHAYADVSFTMPGKGERAEWTGAEAVAGRLSSFGTAWLRAREPGGKIEVGEIEGLIEAVGEKATWLEEPGSIPWTRKWTIRVKRRPGTPVGEVRWEAAERRITAWVRDWLTSKA